MNSSVVPLEAAPSPDLPAGGFSTWLAMMDQAIANGSGSDVPCGECTACCRSAYFIRVAADEAAPRTRIPQALLFPAPGDPAGADLLGYDERGRCPMLSGDDGNGTGAICSIYHDRPRTCRTYDCRIFAATGLAEPDPAKSEVMARAGRWRFDYVDAEDREAHAALCQGADFLRRQMDGALGGLLPGNATQLAMLAVRLHRLLIDLVAEHGSTVPETPAVLERLSSALRALVR